MQRGTVVRASAGRDRDGIFVVLGTEGDKVLICNGRRRPLERPKHKNPSHLEPTEAALSEEELRTNRMIRKALSKLLLTERQNGADD